VLVVAKEVGEEEEDDDVKEKEAEEAFEEVMEVMYDNVVP